MCMCVCMHACVYVCVYVHVCMHMCVCMYVCMYVLTYISPQGIDQYIVEDTELARQDKENYPRTLNVIEGPLMSVSM